MSDNEDVPVSHEDPQSLRRDIARARERMADPTEARAYESDVSARLKANAAERIDDVKAAVSDAAASVASGLTDVRHAAGDAAAGATKNLKSGARDVSKTTKDNLSDAAASLDDAASGAKSSLAEKVSSVKSGLAETVSSVKGGLAETASSVKSIAETASNVKDNIAETASNVKDNLAETASNVKDTIAETASSVKANLEETTSSVKSSLSDLGDNAHEKLETTRSFTLGAKTLLEKNPLGLALGSLAVGFLIGLTIPVSDLERENIGPLGERVGRKAKNSASEVVTQGTAAVSAVVTEALRSSRT